MVGLRLREADTQSGKYAGDALLTLPARFDLQVFDFVEKPE